MCFIFDVFAVAYLDVFYHTYTPTYMNICVCVLLLYLCRADCCKVDEPGKYPHIGGLSKFGKVSESELKWGGCGVNLCAVLKERKKNM